MKTKADSGMRKSEKRTRQTFKSTFESQPHKLQTSREHCNPRPQTESLFVAVSSLPLSLSLFLFISSAILCLVLSVSQYTTLRCLWLVKDYCYHQPGRYANRTGSPPPLVTSPALSSQRVSCNCRPTGSAATSRLPPPSFAPSFLACCCFLVSVSVSLFHRF